jgi:endonuclease/exonuclease/phosphatase (EEP) superfamily protein YafD
MITRVDLGDGEPLTVIGAHPVPPVGGREALLRDEYLRQLGEAAAREGRQADVILLGDLNTTPWSGGFRELLATGGFLDSGRRRGFQSTWMRRHPLFSLPLDHILHSPGLETIDRGIGPELGSDHRPVWVGFRHSGEVGGRDNGGLQAAPPGGDQGRRITR